MLDLLNRIEKDSGYSHLLLDNEMKKEQFLKADRGLLTEVVYGTIQRKITLDYYLNDFVNPNKKNATLGKKPIKNVYLSNGLFR